MRLSPGDGLAVVAGAALALSLVVVPWYGFEVGGTERASLNAFETFTVTDIALAVVALVAIAAPLARAAGLTTAGMAAVGVVGAVGVVLIVLRLVVMPDTGYVAPGTDLPVADTRKSGPFVALVATAAIACAGFWGHARRE